MYNKIASIILNSGKNNNYSGEVFVSQPDSSKERLAGKIFVLAEMEGKKNETQKIINFLINIFDYNYYGDEKILLRDKIDGLKIEDIFETVLARVNQGLIEFLQDERLKINPETTNLTLGVIHEDKLYFSNYGKNKAFLVYRRRGDYEVINVETNAIEGEAVLSSDDDSFAGSKIFSTVINGEIPAHSYFVFANEALPEYLSNRELVNIITKLPPMVAAEQIKNFLQKINSFAPFLGIIVKSTLGGDVRQSSDAYDDDDLGSQMAANKSHQVSNDNRNAHSSISNLNYTEQKTESMLAPAGIINLKKIAKGLTNLWSKFKVDIPENKKIVKFYEELEDREEITKPKKESKNTVLVRRESFAIKEKIVFKKKNYFSFVKIIGFFKALGVLFTPNFWSGAYQGLIAWLKKLNPKDRILVGALTACFLVLVVSIILTAAGNKTRLAAKEFDLAIIEIGNKQAQIDLYTAVSNDYGATELLNNSLALLAAVNPQNEDQKSQKEILFQKLQDQSDKIQKITKIDSFQEVLNLTNTNAQAKVSSVVFLNNKLYLDDGLNKSIYSFNLADSAILKIDLVEAVSLSSPAVYENDLYYLGADSKIVKISGNKAISLNLGADKLTGQNFIQFYNDYLYLLSKDDKQIYKYAKNLNSRTAWLKESVDLSQVSDFKVNGQIIASQLNADLLKFNKGAKVDYKTGALSPAIRADKVLVTAANYYLLDLQNNRVINLTKDGALVKQFRLVKDGVTDFAVDEATKSVYILANNIVYKFGL